MSYSVPLNWESNVRSEVTIGPISGWHMFQNRKEINLPILAENTAYMSIIVEETTIWCH